MTCNVAVSTLQRPLYPQSPYNAPEQYPEYPFTGNYSPCNYVYESVRDIFIKLGYDIEHFGTPEWNPLGHLLKPGQTVVLKPNFVVSKNPNGLFCAITHPSVLRALTDYCYIALEGRGTVIIADAPQYDCDYDLLRKETHLQDIIDFYHEHTTLNIADIDLRPYWSKGKHFKSQLIPLKGDPFGSTIVSVNSFSQLKSNTKKLYGACYNRKELRSFHHGFIHKYQISNTILNADLVISVPKMKVHKKVGVTLNIKGLVGIVTNKNCLAHYTLGTPSTGGDQFPDNLLKPHEKFLIGLERWMYDNLLANGNIITEYLHRSLYAIHNVTTKKLGLKVSPRTRKLDAGNWFGNDTAWRMSVDLYRAFLYSDKEGMLTITPQRKTLSIIDGVIGGEDEGPLQPSPVASGVLIGGENLITTDIVAARLMGFWPYKIPLYRCLWNPDSSWVPEPIQVISDEYQNCLESNSKYFDYLPHPGWINIIEIASPWEKS